MVEGGKKKGRGKTQTCCGGREKKVLECSGGESVDAV